MKKKLPVILLLLAVAAAAVALLYLYPQYKLLKETNALLSGGAYSEAFASYASVLEAPRLSRFGENAQEGLAGCAETALVAGDESFIELSETTDVSALSGEAANRFRTALNGIKTIRADRLEAERIAEERRLRAQENIHTLETACCAFDEQMRLEAEAQARQEEREAAYNAALLSHDHILAGSVIGTMETEEARALFANLAETARTSDINRMRRDWQTRFGAGTWYTALLADTLLVQGDARYLNEEMPAADALFAGDFGMLLIKDGVPSFYGDTLGASKEIAGMNDIVTGSVGMNHALLVHSDGTVTAVGAKQYGKGDVSAWREITAAAAGAFHSVGLDKHGFVSAVGLNADGQCDTGRWRHIVAVDAGMRHTVGLLSDGHVVAAGDNSFGQCEVSGWTDIVAIACGSNHTVGLKRNGTVVAAGDNGAGQCEVAGWRHVLAVDAGMWHTAALLEDGRVIAAGANEHGQCDTEPLRAFRVSEYDVSPEPIRGESSEYIYVQDDKNGPWVYYAKEGAVVISLEDQYSLVATRADLFCTAGVYPEGILSGGRQDKAVGTNMGTTVAKQNHAVFAINGDYYNFGYNPDGVQVRCGNIFKNEITDSKRSLGMAFWPDNTMRVVDSTKIDAYALVELGIRDSWVFGPLLVLDGEAQDISYSPLSYNDVTLRSAIGSVGACHHIALSCGKATLAEVIQLFLDYGCDIAYNLDGGRSVWMTFMGKRVNRTYFNKAGTRNLSDMIGFLHSDKVK